MSIWKGVLVFNDISSGLGWSITTFRDCPSPSDFQTAADAWLSAYMGACNVRVALLQLRVSDPASPGTFEVFDAASFVNNHGMLVGSIVPLAEAALAHGDTAGPIDLGHSKWHLHGIDTTQLKADGTIDPGAAPIVALKTASLAYLLNYRKAATPVHHWPVVSPPTAFVTMGIKGPYVRRLGTTFFRPGQHQRFKT